MNIVNNRKNKTEQLQADLKLLFSNKNYQPGDKLPVITEIENKFNVSKVVVQSAVKKLKQEGFVTSIDRQGLFMSKRPPCLKKIVIAIGGKDNNIHDDIFSKTIINLLKSTNNIWQDFDIEVIDEINNDDSNSLYHLQQYFEKGNCAGLVFIFPDEKLEHKIDFKSIEVPMAAICPKNSYHIPAVFTDGNIFWKKSYDILKRQGCEKIAIIQRNSSISRTKIFLEDEVDIHLNDYYFQGASPTSELATMNLISMMFHPDNKLRPDALIIGDDNLENAILKGLLNINIIPQQDVKIISHCNWPHYNNSPFPITYYGFEAIDILNNAIEMISYQLKHKGTEPEDIRITPVMEHQLKYTNSIFN